MNCLNKDSDMAFYIVQIQYLNLSINLLMHDLIAMFTSLKDIFHDVTEYLVSKISDVWAYSISNVNVKINFNA